MYSTILAHIISSDIIKAVEVQVDLKHYFSLATFHAGERGREVFVLERNSGSRRDRTRHVVNFALSLGCTIHVYMYTEQNTVFIHTVM